MATKKKAKKKTAPKRKKKVIPKKEITKIVEEVVDAPIEKVDLPKAIPVAKAKDQYVEVEGLENRVCTLGRDKYKIEIGKRLKILRAHLPILEGAGRVKKLKI